MEDHEKDFDEKIQLELEKFREIVAENHKFTQLYNWIMGLIDITERLKVKVKKLEHEITEIKKEMKK